jgi:hypothetical protein
MAKPILKIEIINPDINYHEMIIKNIKESDFYISAKEDYHIFIEISTTKSNDRYKLSIIE